MCSNIHSVISHSLYHARMRILLQRVQSASVTVDDQIVGSIERGYLLFIGVLRGDTETEATWLAEKITKLRLFDGEDGKINDRSLVDSKGEALIVSQFTLAGDTAKGNRPDYTAAAAPAEAKRLYEYFIQTIGSLGVKTATGEFGASMAVELINDGPVTLLLERASTKQGT